LSLFSLSPLTTNHLSILQHTPVRSSVNLPIPFNLFMVSSLNFGFILFNFVQPLILKLVFSTPTYLSSLNNITCWPVIQEVRYYNIITIFNNITLTAFMYLISKSQTSISRPRILVYFRILLYLPISLSFTVLFTIDYLIIFKLRGWAPFIHVIFHVYYTTLLLFNKKYSTGLLYLCR